MLIGNHCCSLCTNFVRFFSATRSLRRKNLYVDYFTTVRSDTFGWRRGGAVRHSGDHWSVSVFYKYSLGGDSTAPSRLYARLCHAFLVSSWNTRKLSSSFCLTITGLTFGNSQSWGVVPTTDPTKMNLSVAQPPASRHWKTWNIRAYFSCYLVFYHASCM